METCINEKCLRTLTGDDCGGCGWPGAGKRRAVFARAALLFVLELVALYIWTIG